MRRMRALVLAAALVAGVGASAVPATRPQCTGGACEQCQTMAKALLLLGQTVYCPAHSAPASPLL